MEHPGSRGLGRLEISRTAWEITERDLTPEEIAEYDLYAGQESSATAQDDRYYTHRLSKLAKQSRYCLRLKMEESAFARMNCACMKTDVSLVLTSFG